MPSLVQKWKEYAKFERLVPDFPQESEIDVRVGSKLDQALSLPLCGISGPFPSVLDVTVRLVLKKSGIVKA